MEKEPRRFVAPLLGLVAILVVVAMYMMATTTSKDVDMPADDASPEQVVTAYVEALDSHDCDTAEALVTASKRDGTEAWCRNVRDMTEIQVGSHVVEQMGVTGSTSLRSSAEPKTSGEVVRVPVTFNLEWRLFRADDSIPEGTTDWGYFLVRESPMGPWRVFDEGNG